MGGVAMLMIAVTIQRSPEDKPASVLTQLSVFRDRNLLASLAFTMLGWVGFMTLYGYIAPVAEQIAGFDRSAITWVLVVVGAGLVVGNSIGGRTADANLHRSLIVWPIAMIAALVLVGFLAPYKWLFLIAAFIYGVTTFANLPPMQMRVMKYGSKAPELAATANISAFNIANALGGFIGGAVIDSHLGAVAIPFAAAIIPVLGLLFILSQESRSSKTPTVAAACAAPGN
jgi:DHA1 family inner membrane transport protein